MSSDTQEVAAIGGSTLEATAPESQAAAPAPAVAPTTLEMSIGQIQTLFAEIRAIEKRAHRCTVLASDYASALHPKIDEAIQTANVSKAFLEDLRDRLAISQEATLVAVFVENLLTRLDPNVTDLYQVKTRA